MESMNGYLITFVPFAYCEGVVILHLDELMKKSIGHLDKDFIDILYLVKICSERFSLGFNKY